VPRLVRPSRPGPVPLSARGRAALALAAALLAASCGGGGGDAPAAEASAATEVDWVRGVMKDSYLYADRVPDADLSGAADAAAALAALRVEPPDRFSYVERRSRYEGFFDEGRAFGLGIGWRVDGDRAALRFVQPESPAGRAGLRRGDRLVAVGGTPVATLIAEGRLAQAFGPSEPGTSVTIETERDGARASATVARDWYAVSPVLAARTIVRDGTTVGYVALYTFTEPARAAWAEAIRTLAEAGARRLVVDLRDNGGGRLFVAAEVAGSLAPAEAVGQTFAELRFNARRAGDALRIPVPATPTTAVFERVVWLVSEQSCSATESLIAGLRPFRADAIVGTRTCGKPVGFEPRTRGETVLSAVSFEGVNRDGFGGWFDGLAPTCTVADEPLRPYGDETDPRLAEALRWLSTGACGPTAAAQAKSLPARPPREPGLAGETGLH